jgi:hypothetical protein
VHSLGNTNRSSFQVKDPIKTRPSSGPSGHIEQAQSSHISYDKHTATEHEYPTDNNVPSFRHKQKVYQHDVLVIHTQPPQVNTVKLLFAFVLFFSIYVQARAVVESVFSTAHA